MSTKPNAAPPVTAAGSSEGTAAYPRPEAPLTPLGDLLAELAAARPDHPAITTGHRTVTRDDVERRTNGLARAYADRGVRQGSLVTIMLPNGIEFMLATIAAWKLGATPQPVSPTLPRAELERILALADPALVVGGDPAGIGGRPSVPAGYEARDFGSSPVPGRISPVWKAPTSGGSTGAPKLILAGQPASAELMRLYQAVFQMQPDDTHLVVGPLTHNGPFLMAAAALFHGNHLVIAPRFDAADTLRLITQHQVNWLMLVPTMMHRIVRLPEVTDANLSSLRVVLHTAAPCPQWLKREWLHLLGPERLLELYATTEGHAGTVISGSEWLTHPGSVGRVVTGEISVRDAAGEPVEAGVDGDIWVRPAPGSPATYRYLGAEAEGLPGGWECQGDRGWFDADGYLYLGDRKQDMILVGGANVYPAEIESALDEHPDVQSSCVIGLPDDEYGNRIHAIVQSSVELDADVLLPHLRERLVPYKLPRSFERVSHPLRDDAGKARRTQLRAERI